MGRSGIGLARAGRRRLSGTTPTPAPASFTAVAADGWQATVGSPADLSLAPAAVTRQGFDAAGAATTYVDTLYLTKRVRQTYPNQASFTTDQVALSDYVYSTDTIAGAINSSVETSPKPVAAWIMPDRTIVGNSLTVELVAFHRNARGGQQVACVVFRVTDGINTVTATVIATAVSGGAYDLCAVPSHKATLDISTLSDNANITVNAKVYPWIGGAASVLDSADQSVLREFSPRTFRRNTTRAAAPYIIRIKSGGNDSTGAVSTNAATADASPCLTLGGAINRARAVLGTATGALDGLRIQFDSGTWVHTGAPTANTINAMIVIEPIPGVAKASCIIQFGSAAAGFNLGYYSFRGLTLQRAGASALSGTTSALFEDCIVDFNGNTTTPMTLAGTTAFFVGVSFGANDPGIQPGSGTFHALFRGCMGGTVNSAGQREWYVSVGCEWTGGRMASLSARSQSGTVVAFNKFLAAGSAAGGVFALSEPSITGAAIVQNLVEWTFASGALGIGVSADGLVANTTHVVMHHNTFTGAFIAGRCNLFYDETTGSTVRTHKLMSCKGNIHVQINTKSDVFKNDGTRIGNFAYEHGVGCDAEFSQFIDASGGSDAFRQEYPGLRASVGSSQTVRNDPLFTSYAGATFNGSTYSAGAGGGTYTLQVGSPCLARLPVAVLSHDLAGTPRAMTNNAAGAYA